MGREVNRMERVNKVYRVHKVYKVKKVSRVKMAFIIGWQKERMQIIAV
jgi:hypothetical protein